MGLSSIIPPIMASAAVLETKTDTMKVSVVLRFIKAALFINAFTLQLTTATLKKSA